MIKYAIINDYDAIRELWNREVGFIYPIAQDVFTQNVIDYPKKLAIGAYVDNDLVGFVIGKKNITDIDTYQKIGWISLIYVAKKYRRQKIGSILLKRIEEYLKDVDLINVGKDINNFFPGVPMDFNKVTDVFFIKRGYSDLGTTHDLINTSPKELSLKNKNYQYLICTLEHKDPLIAFMETNFPGRWTYEVKKYFDNGGDGSEYVICMDKDKVIAFARINDRKIKEIHYNITWYLRFKNLGGIGPLGVDAMYRGQDIGYDIVAMGMNTLINRGILEIIIDWTSLLAFYQQFGFEVWKNYKYLSKKG